MSDEYEQSGHENEDSGGPPLISVDGILRQRWFLLAPLLVCGLCGFVVSHLLPLKYKSTAFIIVEQQKIPESYVLPNVLMTLQKRLDSMTQQILSRTRLQRFIEDFNLYSSERSSKAMDDIIDKMREQVSVELVQTPGRQSDVIGFKVHFSDTDRFRAQQVTNELTSLFIEQDARERSEQSQRTTAFLESQLQEAQKLLAEEEEKVREYKLAHLGELPEQQQSNLQLLSSLEAQLHASTAALDRAEQQRAYLESMRAQQEAFAAIPRVGEDKKEQSEAEAANANSVAVAQVIVADLWKKLNAATARLTERHPEVIALKKEVADWEATVRRMRTENAAATELAGRLKAIAVELENERRQSGELRSRITEVQFRLSQTPVREAELAELTRHHENARSHYQSLLQKKLDSELASNLEQRQAGEQFRLLDPASLPKRPEGRARIVLAGWALGAGLGVILMLFREGADQSVRRKADLEAYNWLPVVGRIPTVRSADEQRQLRFNRLIELTAFGVMLLISLGTGAHVYLFG
ncbi:MAG: hypothetical protein R2729_23435 [Bryobacteraceae bacterium]